MILVKNIKQKIKFCISNKNKIKSKICKYKGAKINECTSIIIPARYGSSRYRGKPLVKILKREMVLRVADICSKVVNKKNLFIATDSKKIANVVKKAKYNVLMTSSTCLTGTDRVAEASKKLNSKIYINVQGDEPTINPNDIKKIIKAKKKFPNHVICGYDKVHKFENPSNINLPKVVVNEKQELIYISRALIPGSKKDKRLSVFKTSMYLCI